MAEIKQSRQLQREIPIRTYSSLEVRLQALHDLGMSLRAAAGDLKRVILNGDAPPEEDHEVVKQKVEKS